MDINDIIARYAISVTVDDVEILYRVADDENIANNIYDEYYKHITGVYDCDKYYIVVYTERTTGDKELFVNNPEYKKTIRMEIPKYDFKNDVINDFTTSDLKHMCELVGLEYPIKEK